MFSKLSKNSLARALLLKDQPVYVQFYITARCNLTCQQCNVIYANADMRECTISEIERIADNLAAMGVAIVLLTGGEPFIRHDLPQIIRAFESRGVHVRMQTNGLATEAQVAAAIDAGGKDISISLDSLVPATQDHINGGFPGSWERAIRAMGMFSRLLPPEDSFASLGCVLQRDNLGDIEDVVRFGSAAGWYTSLVPVHVTGNGRPRGFRTFDRAQRFAAAELPAVTRVVERVRAMRREGFLLYDSDQYLDDILRFVGDQPVTWRDRNDGLCDTPALYFAILPNGQFAPCCDHRIRTPVFAYAADFPQVYRQRAFRAEVHAAAAACEGCMYGSYPEITISMRYLAATVQRIGTFLASPPKKPWPIDEDAMLALAARHRAAATA